MKKEKLILAIGIMSLIIATSIFSLNFYYNAKRMPILPVGDCEKMGYVQVETVNKIVEYNNELIPLVNVAYNLTLKELPYFIDSSG